jgi:hypothetical protein
MAIVVLVVQFVLNCIEFMVNGVLEQCVLYVQYVLYVMYVQYAQYI